MSPDLLRTILISAFLVFVIYRRIRRNVGRQPFRPVRMGFRILLLGTIGVLILFTGRMSVAATAGAAAGATAGLVLTFYALRHTRFETTPEGTFYTPHPYIGLGVTALLIGRIGYRLMALQGSTGHDQHPPAHPFAMLQGNPVTLGFYFVLSSYYIAYYLGLFSRSRHHPDPALEPAPVEQGLSRP